MFSSISTIMALPDEASIRDKSVCRVSCRQYRPSVVRTLTGLVDVDRPVASQVRVRDMVWSLSMICRYNGHAPVFYSVAEHSVLSVGLSEVLGPDLGDTVRLAVLCHDLHEAYVGDCIRPLKSVLQDFRRLEEGWELAVAEYLGIFLTPGEQSHVREVDLLMAIIEMSTFYDDPPERQLAASLGLESALLRKPEGWSPERARDEFMGVLERLRPGSACTPDGTSLQGFGKERL